jgi:hypothetical protein
MPRVNNTYVVPFEPVRDGPGEFAFGRSRFNVQRVREEEGLKIRPVPLLSSAVYQRSERCSVESDSFEDLQLHDFVEANKRWADVG